MTLTPLAIALQGIGFTVLAEALQGFAELEAAIPPAQSYYRTRVRVQRRKREEDEALLLFIL